jgi:hypothetical protein
VSWRPVNVDPWSTCNGCHTADSFPLVPEAEAKALIEAEIERALAAARQAVDTARATR